MVINDKKKG
jgi:hypothetical protein